MHIKIAVRAAITTHRGIFLLAAAVGDAFLFADVAAVEGVWSGLFALIYFVRGGHEGWVLTNKKKDWVWFNAFMKYENLKRSFNIVKSQKWCTRY